MSQSSSLPAFVARQQLDTVAWDTCVSSSPHQIVYGYSWYLDAVLPAPDWQWIGLVHHDEQGGYLAVMPVPLRRKQVAGITQWVVHQPFFCQFLSIFGLDRSVDPTPFLMAIQQRFRYGSVLNLYGWSKKLAGNEVYTFTNYVLDLSVGYERVFTNYSRDRRLNLQRAKAADWTVIDSTDVKPLLTLFRENHADTIKGGVADWAYDLLEKLSDELNKRDLRTVRYAVHQGTIEAGALFVRGGNRIIYLFNAASKMGRQKNARTLLIDQVIREYAGQQLVFDFESPQKPSIGSFYRSFGASEELFQSIRWSRLTVLERAFLRVRRLFMVKNGKSSN